MATKPKGSWANIRKKLLADAESQQARTQIRLPCILHIKLVEAAKRNHRSLNAEMLSRLESTFP